MLDRDQHNQHYAEVDDNGDLSILEQRRRWHLARLRKALMEDDGPAAMTALDGLEDLASDEVAA